MKVGLLGSVSWLCLVALRPVRALAPGRVAARLNLTGPENQGQAVLVWQFVSELEPLPVVLAWHVLAPALPFKTL